MKARFFIILTALICGLALIFLWRQSGKTAVTKNVDNALSMAFPTHWDNKEFRFVSREEGPTIWKTDVYVKNEEAPRLTLNGYYRNSKFHNLGVNKTQYLEILLLSGKLINSQLYDYSSGQLKKIFALKEIWASADPEYKDIDGDGIKEMLVYHQLGLLEEPRIVEVYNITNGRLQKQTEFLEKI